MTEIDMVNTNGIRHRVFSFRRIAAITWNTLIELTRQKVFYFVLLFALLLIATSGFLAPLSFQQEFQLLKDVALGAMSIFISLLSIVSTARLLSQELEERTLYTILAKPVSRFEYLLGKLGGVILLLAIGLMFMSALFFAVLYLREQTVLNQTARAVSGLPPAQINDTLRNIRASAFNANLLPAIIIIFCKGCLLASLTLFVSTFATSNIFTIVVMAFIYFIGHLQATARNYWLQQQSAGWLKHAFAGFVALIFPDLQAFNLIDDAVAGVAIPCALFLKTALLGAFYVTIYLLLAAVVFYSKEL
jgi:ABC-2 type transport system permease protein